MWLFWAVLVSHIRIPQAVGCGTGSKSIPNRINWISWSMIELLTNLFVQVRGELSYNPDRMLVSSERDDVQFRREDERSLFASSCAGTRASRKRLVAESAPELPDRSETALEAAGGGLGCGGVWQPTVARAQIAGRARGAAWQQQQLVLLRQ